MQTPEYIISHVKELQNRCISDVGRYFCLSICIHWCIEFILSFLIEGSQTKILQHYLFPLIGQEFYECVVCQSCMSGIVPAKSHLEGSRHLKALRNKAYTAVLTSCANLNISRDGPDLSPSYQDLSRVEKTSSYSDDSDDG